MRPQRRRASCTGSTHDSWGCKLTAYLLGVRVPPGSVMHRVRRSFTPDTKVVRSQTCFEHACLRPYCIACNCRKSTTNPARKGRLTKALPNDCGRRWHITAVAILEKLHAVRF